MRAVRCVDARVRGAVVPSRASARGDDVGCAARSASRARRGAVLARVARVTFVPSDGGDVIVADVRSDEVLRTCAQRTKGVKLYGAWDAAMNCGGVGNCGTCVVDVRRGSEFLSERTDAETRKARAGKLGETWRLACQTVVRAEGDGEVEVVTRPKK